MTISSTLNRVSYTGNGATTAFAVSFPFHAKADLVVLEVVIATGAQTTKTLTTHYTISGSTDALGHYSNGGTVNAVTAPASTVRWVIYRDPMRTQSLDLQDANSFPAENIEAQLDYATMLIQRVEDLIGRSLRQPDGDTSAVGLLPSSVERASKYLSFDSSGNPTAITELTPGSVTISVFAESYLDDASADVFIETIADAATAETAPATGDLVLLSDVSANSGRKMTLSNVLKVVNALTEDTTPDKTADFVLAYDASASGPKKVTPTNLIPFASQAEVNAMTSTTTALSPNVNTIVLETSQATTSGTSFSYTNIPSGVRRVIITMAGVSLSGTDDILVQIGPSGGVEPTGYVSTALRFSTVPSTVAASSTSGFVVKGDSATYVTSGVLMLEMMNSSTNQWVASGTYSLNATNGGFSGGHKSLAGVLARLTIFTTGSNTFDAGEINIKYER